MPSQIFRHLTVLCLLLLAASCSQETELTTTERFKRAAIFEQQGDINSAIIEYKNVLQTSPANFEARWRLGRLYLDARLWRPAEKELRVATTLDSGIPKARLDLARALLPQRRFDEALAALSHETMATMEENSRYHILSGQAQVELAQIPEAKRSFERALTLQPGNIGATLGMARVNLETNNWSNAEDLISDVLSDLPSHVDALLLQGDLQRLRNDRRDAIRTYTRVIDIDPSNISAYLSRAQVLLSDGKFDAALLDAELLKKYVPDYPISDYIQALAEFGQGNYEAAESSVRKVLTSVPTHADGLLLLASIQYKNGAFESAVSNLDLHLDKKPSNAYARILMAEILLNQDKPERAVSTLLPISAHAENDIRLAGILGTAYLRAGHAAKGMELFQRVVDKNPDAAHVHATFGLVLAATKRNDEAIEALENALQLGTDSVGIETILCLLHLRNQHYELALEKADRISTVQPTAPLSAYLKGLILTSQGDARSGRQHFSEALQLQRDYIPAAIALAHLEVAAGDPDALGRRLQDILEYDRENIDVLTRLAKYYDHRQAFHRANDYWEQTLAIDDQQLEHHLALVQSYLNIDETRKAIGAALRAREQFEDDLQVLDLLGSALLRDGQTPQAVAVFTRLTELEPGAPRHQYQLAMAMLVSGDTDAAVERLNHALDLGPAHLPSMLLLSRTELDNGETEAALEIAQRMLNSYPNLPDAHLLLGDIFFLKTDYRKALTEYSKGFEMSGNVLFLVNVHKTHRLLDENKTSRTILHDWLETHPNDVGMRMNLAHALLLDGFPEEALEQYLLAIDKDPGVAEAHNNLAWLLFKKRDQRALEHAERAFQLDRNSPAFADTLGWIMVHLADKHEGLALLDQFVKRFPHIREMRYHLGVALFLTGNSHRAEIEIERALKEGSFEGEKEAKLLLEKLRNATAPGGNTARTLTDS